MALHDLRRMARIFLGLRVPTVSVRYELGLAFPVKCMSMKKIILIAALLAGFSVQAQADSLSDNGKKPAYTQEVDHEFRYEDIGLGNAAPTDRSAGFHPTNPFSDFSWSEFVSGWTKPAPVSTDPISNTVQAEVPTTNPAAVGYFLLGLYEIITTIYWFIKIRPELKRIHDAYYAKGLQTPGDVLLWGTPVLKSFMIVNVIAAVIIGAIVGWNSAGQWQAGSEGIGHSMCALTTGALYGLIGICATVLPYYVIGFFCFAIVIGTAGLALLWVQKIWNAVIYRS
jgi:hypothetical protein